MNESPHYSRALSSILILFALALGLAATAKAQNWNSNGSQWQGRLRGDDQQRFDNYYQKWIQNRERKDTGEIASMEVRMLDVYAHNGIPADVPYDVVASPNVAPNNGYDNYRGRLRGDDQKRFDSYYSRLMEYRKKKDREQIASMQGRMLDVYAHNDIPLATPYEFVASPNVVPAGYGQGRNSEYNRGYNDSGYNNGGSLRILQAFYGAPGRQADVAGRLQNLATNNGIGVRVNNDSMGSDPAPGSRKRLYVVYSYRGQQRSVTVDEGNELQIP